MANRLPLPLSTIKNIQSLIEENSTNLWLRNPLYNALRSICAYDYKDAIDTLVVLQKDHPALMDYTKHIAAINRAHKRYEAMPM
jgi:hypothetical protein